MAQTTDEQHQLEISIPVSSDHANNTTRLKPNLPRRHLLAGPRAYYLRTAVPLYKASSKGDWKAAEDILYNRPELVRYSITENGETALHIAASAKRSKKVAEFVENLVDLMDEEDLMLENENFNTAFYLAATSGNVETIKIMVRKSRALLTIPGAMGQMMPLSAAALFGKYDVVKYLYENSKDLCEDGWNTRNRGWLLEKCVDNDMFDVALQIVKTYPELGSGIVLKVLARKTGVFSETKYNNIQKIINWVFAFIISKVRPERESEALPLLRTVWEDIARKPKNEIDRILRGPPDLIKQDKSASESVVQALLLRKLIFKHLDKMRHETQNIVRGQPDMTNQDTNLASRMVDQSLQLQNLISESIVNMHIETSSMIKEDNKPFSGKAGQAPELERLISGHIVNMHYETQKILEMSGKNDQTMQLKDIILKNIDKMHRETQQVVKRPIKETHSSQVLFIAAEMGNTNFLVELIRRYPDLIRTVNDNNQSIFHIAVKNRHEGIYNLLYEIGSMKDLVTTLRDKDDNNMLHLAAKSTQKKRLEDVSGAALQMQRELLWFKEVESMIPPSYREQENKDGLTPRELFSEEHKYLITQGEKWMKETASQCMVVAALIATIVFAAAFTVPGGYNQNDGIPMFYQEITFVVFVVADAISLFLSSASILTFLSILTARFAERDFMKKLPKKLMLGLAALFLSITTMVVTFSISFFILYHKEMKWIPILIAVFAVSPVLLYVVLQYHLLVDVIRSTYGQKYLFKPRNQVLFYENLKL